MKQLWNQDELIEYWSLTTDEQSLLEQRTERGRLGLAVLLKYFQLEGRFPHYHKEVPLIATDFVADQLNVPVSAWFDYPLKGRSGKRDREQLRVFLGVRPANADDNQSIQDWLYQQIVPHNQEPSHLRAAVLEWCRTHQIEPPSSDRIDRLVNAAVRTFENKLYADIHRALSPATCQKLDELLATTAEETTDTDLNALLSPFSELKTDPGRIGLASVLKQVEKLQRIDALQIPDTLLAPLSPKLIERYRRRAATETVWQLRRHPDVIRYTLLALFCWQRRRMIIDDLIELLIQIVHRISVKAKRKVTTALIGDIDKVQGKTVLLFRLAEAAIDQPDGAVKDVLFPVANEATLQALVKEYHSKGPRYQRHVHLLIRRSYSHHYRRMLPLILDALIFRSNNARYQPIINALAWLKAHRHSRQQFVSIDDVPMDGVVRPQQQDLLLEDEGDSTPRMNRINYEICVLQSLRERLRCKEIWVEGADHYRNPDDDLPGDFEPHRADYYQALNQPQDVEHFIQDLQQTMTQALTTLDAELPKSPKVRLRTQGKNKIIITPLEAQPEPAQLLGLKAEINRRWPMTSLLDVLKETDLRVGFTDVFQTMGRREVLDRSTVQRRLLLCLYGLGTNAGLKRMVSNNATITYAELLYIRRRYIEKNALREAIRRIVNATFAARISSIWGEGTTACASDGKKFGAWDQNLMTEWHIRYGGRGVMIYWHVEKQSACIYSQLKRCSSSEVAAMIEGVMRHCTEMAIDQQYVDSKGQSEVAFAFCHLLGFDLLPRLKAMASQKLYRPVSGRPEDYPNLQPILTHPINWTLIRQQYNEMVKFATALRLGTAEPEAILRRFTRNNVQHPTYQALAELGRAVKTIFLCRYLSAERVRQEINEGLNVVENWNSANSFVFFGKGGEIATNRLEDQEFAVLSLHLVQACLVYINTLLIQNVLAEPQWLHKMEPADWRGLSPLIYNHINPYGTFELDMASRLLIELVLTA